MLTTWIVWVFAALVLNIIFMNFIIAVISESYEKVMQKLVAQLYKVKCELIVEREANMNEQDLNNPKYFPKYLILRRPIESGETEGQEWQGFIKDLKQNIAKTVARSKNDVTMRINKV